MLTAETLVNDVANELGIQRLEYPPFPDDWQDPVVYLESQCYLKETGYPIQLIDEHKVVLREMLRRDANGHFVYEVLVWSAPKKSGKTQICAGIAQWQAERLAAGEIYIVGNDLKQADNRMNQAIRESLALNPRTAHVKPIRNNVRLPNGSRIEAVPVDPAGEAGSNPTGIFWTEAWGAKQKKHEEMFSEMNLSSTRMGMAFKLLESYAGHTGESAILERLYNAGVKEGTPHPTIPDLYINGRLIVYWCTRHIQPWQQGQTYIDFLAARETEMLPNEFRRQYWNEWTSALSAFVDINLWRRRQRHIPPLDSSTPVVIGIDAAVSNDCCAIVVVSRNGEVTQVRETHIWYPPEGGEIQLEEIYNKLLDLYSRYNVIVTVYDPMQMESIAQRIRAEHVWIESFNQGKDREIADKLLLDDIIAGRIEHDGNPSLDEHMQNANAKIVGEDKLRIVKRHETAKIDADIALSMANKRIRDFNL